MASRNPLNLIPLSNEDSFDYLFKLVLIGDCGSGKSCIVKRFKNNQFLERHSNTIGVDFSMKTVKIKDKNVKLQVWDTAGHEKFKTITQSYYRSANGVIIVYDITKKQSFLNVQKWIEEVRRYTASNVLIALVGNKCDLIEEREVELLEAESMCEFVPEIMFQIETSAKDNFNIESTFIKIGAELMNRQTTNVDDDVAADQVKLGHSNPISSSNCSC